MTRGREDFWGDLYDGTQARSFTRLEENMRRLVLSGDMGVHRAVQTLNDMKDDVPWYSRLEYLTAMAALTAAFADEMRRKTYQQGRTLQQVIWSATAPDRLAWQWNALVIRSRLPPHMRVLLGAGTAPNEALHAEVNGWYRNQPEVLLDLKGGGQQS